ncbi:MAG: hypothetical protein Q4C70_14210, partial [Planctomycetia bacterium]|nr:hypothetical protein [Planctomycetia bacterium]
YLLYLKNSKTAENNGDAQEIAQSDDIQGNLNADNSANVGNSDAFMAGNMDEIVKAVDADYQVPNFDAVRQSLTELNFIHARNQLLDIEKMSLSPKNKERLGRLQKVVQYSSDFHTQMNDMVLKLTPPVELCDGEYGLVEVKEIEDEDYVDGAEIKVKKTRVVIRINGKNVRFMMSSPKKQGNNLYDILYRHRFAAMTEAGNMNPALGYAVLELITADGDDETALKLLNTVSQKGTDEQKVTVRQIYDEFNINGLGAMTDIAAAEEQAENADSEKVAENAKEAETLEEADTKKETAKATDNEALKETEKAVSEFKIPEAEDADAKGKVSKKSKKRKSADDDDVDAEDDDDTKVADNKVDDDEEDAEAQAAERHKKEWELLTTTVRQDLSWRRLSAVRRNLMQLEKLAQTEEEKDEHYRLTLLTENMELFVSWIAQHMGNFQPGTTVSANGVDVGVVESTQGRLVIRDQGINKTYTTENLNPKLVEWLVVKSLKAADDYVIYGTYLAMDSEGDRAKAKSYWSTAVGKGFDKMTIDLLMKELDVELPDSGRRPTQQMQNARTGRGKVDMMEPQVIPTGDDYEKAFNAVKKEFAKDYAKSDVRSQMKMVAKFMKQAQDSDRDSAQAYVMAEEAHKIALKNGYYENAYEALMIQETRFQRDTYQERMEMITDANPTIRGQSSSTELVDCALKMGMDAVQRKKKIDANRLLGIARKNAKGSQVKRAQSLEQQLNMMK